MADETRARKRRKPSKRLSKAKISNIVQDINNNSQEEVFGKVVEAVKKTWTKPLCLEDNKSNFSSVINKAESNRDMSSQCKAIFDQLVHLFEKGKGADRAPKLLAEWIELMNIILNDESHPLKTLIGNLSPSIERRELHDVASCEHKG